MDKEQDGAEKAPSVEAPASAETDGSETLAELEAAREKINALTAREQELTSELSKQKAANYDLLTAVRADAQQGDDDGGQDDAGDDQPDVDDLFE